MKTLQTKKRKAALVGSQTGKHNSIIYRSNTKNLTKFTHRGD